MGLFFWRVRKADAGDPLFTCLILPFIFSFTLLASFSIWSAFLMTSSEMMFSLVLSTYCFSSVANSSSFSVSRLISCWRCRFCFFCIALRCWADRDPPLGRRRAGYDGSCSAGDSVGAVQRQCKGKQHKDHHPEVRSAEKSVSCDHSDYSRGGSVSAARRYRESRAAARWLL